jgi:RNA polymerase sigma-70 factor, ECF subfamily
MGVRGHERHLDGSTYNMVGVFLTPDGAIEKFAQRQIIGRNASIEQDMSIVRRLEECYDAHAQALFACLLNLTGNEAETRDTLQEVFLRLAARPGLLDGARDARRFLLRMAHNLAIDRMRRRIAREHAVSALARESAERFAPSPDPDVGFFRRELAVALDGLPIEQRAVVHLRLWEELTFDAIAEVLEIPLNTAASRYRYGVDKLRERLRHLYREMQ